MAAPDRQQAAALVYLSPAEAPPPIGRYSQLSVVPAGAKLARVSGQIGIDDNGDIPRSLKAQMRIIFRSIAALLRSQGATPKHLTFLRYYLTPREDVEDFTEARAEIYDVWFGKSGPFPAATVLWVHALARKELVIEVEAEFVVP